MASAPRRLLSLIVSLWALPVGAWHILRLRRCGTKRHIFAARQCVESLGLPAPVAGGTPLRRLAPGVFEIERRWFAPFPVEPQPGLIVVHLLGTGEHLHSPLPGLEKQCMMQPGLAAYRHLVVDTPEDSAAFESPGAFAFAQWRALRPVLEQQPAHAVLAGFGRGALAAVDIAPRLAQLDGRRVGVLAMSLPLRLAPVRSRVQRRIGALHGLALRVAAAQRDMPDALLRANDWMLRRLAATAAGYLLTELNMDSRPNLRWSAWDITQRRPVSMLVRLCRELHLLEAQRRQDVETHVARAAGALAKQGTTTWTLLFAAEDGWLDVPASMALCESICSVAGVPGDRVRLDLLPGWGHAIGRDAGGDYGELAQRALEACERVGVRPRETRSSHIRLTSKGTGAAPGRAKRRAR